MSKNENVLSNAKATSKKIVTALVNFVGASCAVLIGGFLLIGVYHTLIFFCMRLSPFLFYSLVPAATIYFAVGVTFFKDPVYKLLSLIAVFLAAILFYLYAGAEFLAFLFLIVYVGAIAILFLFVIMLLRLKEGQTEFDLVRS